MNLPYISTRSKSARLAPSYFVVAFVFCAGSMGGPPVSASLINFTGFSSDGHPVSGSAEFTLNAATDTVTVELTNTTANTFDAGELFTGLDFYLGGLTPSLTSDTGIRRTVADNGTFSDTGVAQNLSWQLVPLGGGNFQLNFSPNAEDAIIGPPTAGSYSGANGSIKGNAGHNPFAAEMAVFVLSVPNLEDSTPVRVTTFRYGTRLDPAVPEPSTIVLALVSVALVAMRRSRQVN